MWGVDHHTSGDLSACFASVMPGSGAILSWTVLFCGELVSDDEKVGALFEGQKRAFRKNFFQDVVSIRYGW